MAMIELYAKMLLVSENFATERKIADFDKYDEDIGNQSEKRHYHNVPFTYICKLLGS